MGTRLSSMKRREVSRTRRSSSESRESNSIKSTPLNLKTGIISSLGTVRYSPGGQKCERPNQDSRSKLAEATNRVKPYAVAWQLSPERLILMRCWSVLVSAAPSSGQITKVAEGEYHVRGGEAGHLSKNALDHRILYTGIYTRKQGYLESAGARIAARRYSCSNSIKCWIGDFALFAQDGKRRR